MLSTSPALKAPPEQSTQLYHIVYIQQTRIIPSTLVYISLKSCFSISSHLIPTHHSSVWDVKTPSLRWIFSVPGRIYVQALKHPPASTARCWGNQNEHNGIAIRTLVRSGEPVTVYFRENRAIKGHKCDTWFGCFPMQMKGVTPHAILKETD